MPFDRYFDKFPITNYSNTNVVDITKRTVVINKILENPYVYYPYDIAFDERPDQFSYRYYNDQFKSWILYLSNKIVDPYYEWYMSEKQFLDYIQNKYGSTYNAYQKIKFYRNNWPEATNIAVNVFDALPATLQPYWQPVAFNGQIAEYSRKQDNWSTTTNRIVSYAVSNTNFILDEICTINFDGTHTGKGQISATDSNTIFIQHTSGDVLTSNTVTISNTSFIYGTESGVNTVFTSANLVVSNLRAEEESYWTPVTYFDYENEKNEFNKTILVLDPKFTQTTVQNLTDLMKE